MFAIKIPYFDLVGSCAANPCCYWCKIAPETVLIIDDGTAVLVSQKRENVCFSCSFEEFCNKWYFYFDIGTDYSLLHDRTAAALKDETKICQILAKRRGLRLFKIEWFEGLLKSFLLAIAPVQARKAFELLTMHFSRSAELRLYQRPLVRFKPFPSPAVLCASAQVSIEQALFEALPEAAAIAFSTFANCVFSGNFEQENTVESAADFEQYCSNFVFSKYLSSEHLHKFSVYVWRYCCGSKNVYLGGDFSKYSEFNNFAYFAEWYKKIDDIIGFVEFAIKAGEKDGNTRKH